MTALQDLGLEAGQVVTHLDDGRDYIVVSAKRDGWRAGVVVMAYPVDDPGAVRKFRPRKLAAGDTLVASARPGPDEPDPPRTAARILVLDIETRPAEAYVWGSYDQNVSPKQIIRGKETISWAAKWLGETVKSAAPGDDALREETLFSSVFHEGRDTMVGRAHDLLDEAFAVITYNGERFDVPHLNTEFLRDGLTPPSPFGQIDLLKTVRRQFALVSNRLDHVVDDLDIGSKMEHEGFELWVKCIADDPEAWDRMRAYNMHDVTLTEELYYRIRPWIKQHPSVASLEADTRCPVCGDVDLTSGEGYTYKPAVYKTKTSTYPLYRCGVCGSWSRGTRRIAHTNVTQTA